MSLEDFFYNLWTQTMWKSGAKIAAAVVALFHPWVIVVLLLIGFPIWLCWRIVRDLIRAATAGNTRWENLQVVAWCALVFYAWHSGMLADFWAHTPGGH